MSTTSPRETHTHIHNMQQQKQQTNVNNTENLYQLHTFRFMYTLYIVQISAVRSAFAPTGSLLHI